MIHVCPTQEVMDLWEKIPSEMTLKTEVEDKPSCPLCLLAVTQIYNAIKNDKTEVIYLFFKYYCRGHSLSHIPLVQILSFSL